jgi:hypothetical protein
VDLLEQFHCSSSTLVGGNWHYGNKSNLFVPCFGWKSISNEYDKYVQEIVSDINEWYGGSETSLSFQNYMKAKITKGEAFMATDKNNNCCGVVAISKTKNNITFFAISHKYDFLKVGDLLLTQSLSILNKKARIKTNIIKSDAEQIRKQHMLFKKHGFIFSHDDLENGVPVRCLIR